MSTIQAELYDALLEAGVSEPKARAAASAATEVATEAAVKAANEAAKETIATYPKSDELATVSDIGRLEAKIEKVETNLRAEIKEVKTGLEGRINLVHWMVGFNLALTVVILFKMF